MRIPHRSHTTHTRDAALRDLHRINRWMIAGSVVLTGVLSDVAANAFPGKTVKHASTSSSSKGAQKKRGSSSKTSTGVLRAPQQPPAKAESEPAQEAAPSEPSQQSAPAHEAEPAPEAAPQQESPPASEAAREPESTPPVQEAAPEPEAPVVSGGS